MKSVNEGREKIGYNPNATFQDATKKDFYVSKERLFTINIKEALYISVSGRHLEVKYKSDERIYFDCDTPEDAAEVFNEISKLLP